MDGSAGNEMTRSPQERSLSSNGNVDVAVVPAQTSVPGMQRSKRVSWADDGTSPANALRSSAGENIRAEIVGLPEISDLWLDEHEDGKTIKEPTNDLERLQLKVRGFVDHLSVRIVGILLIFLDIILMIIDLSIGTKTTTSQLFYDGMALALSCIFMIDVLARIFAYGIKEFFKNPWEVLDAVVVLSTFIVTIVYTALDEVISTVDADGLGRLIVLARLLRVVRVARIFYSQRQLKQSTRRTISQNKRRYQKDGFDLDLTFVTDRVIAMSFPSSGFQSFFRNPIKEVSRFFNTKYPEKYKIYNLCSERSYDTSYFDDRVYRVMIDDHNVPSISDMLKFVADVKQWMSSDDSNVVAIHCKGGKGRTGTAVSAWLLEDGQFDNAKDVLEFFGSRRTDLEEGLTFQGVETASQIRYVEYFEKIKKEFDGVAPPERRVKLVSVTIKSISGIGRGNGSDLSMQVLLNKEEVVMCKFAEEYNCKVQHQSSENSVVCDITSFPVLFGDVKLRFTSSAKNLPRGYDNCAFYFWINTSFIDGTQLTLSREEIDNPHKKKTWHIFKEDFAIELNFQDA